MERDIGRLKVRSFFIVPAQGLHALAFCARTLLMLTAAHVSRWCQSSASVCFPSPACRSSWADEWRCL